MHSKASVSARQDKRWPPGAEIRDAHQGGAQQEGHGGSPQSLVGCCNPVLCGGDKRSEDDTSNAHLQS